MPTNPYLAGLDLVKKHHGTSGQTALAKCILSLYNGPVHGYGMAEILASLDDHYTKVVLAMIKEYAANGETPELRSAGSYVAKEFPRLVELSLASYEAKNAVRSRWEREREEESRRLYPNG